MHQIVIFVEICGLNMKFRWLADIEQKHINMCLPWTRWFSTFYKQICIGMIHCDCQQNSTKRGRSKSGSLLLNSTISLKTKQVMLIHVYVSMQICKKWHDFCYRWIRTNGFFEQLTGLASPWTLGSLALCQGWYLLRLQKPQWTSPLLHASRMPLSTSKSSTLNW